MDLTDAGAGVDRPTGAVVRVAADLDRALGDIRRPLVVALGACFSRSTDSNEHPFARAPEGVRALGAIACGRQVATKNEKTPGTMRSRGSF
jgi:hypothetical protein